MSTYIIRRILHTIVILFLVSFLSFILLQLVPGDPAASMLGIDAKREEVEAMREELWLDRPILVQYGHWLSNALQGDLGKSLMFQETVGQIFLDRLPVTLYLSLIAFVVSSILGIGAGIICAIRRGGILDQLVSLCANVGIAIPMFWLGILGIYFFGLKAGWLPIYGWTSPFDDFVLSCKKALMPIILLSTPGIAVLTRQSRSSMLEVVSQDYIRTALSKGLSEKIVLLRHALKNALIPVITLMGLHVRQMVGGSVLVETVFSIPGMGRVLVSSAINKDFLVVQGGVLLIGIIVCFSNLTVDILYGWLNPRLRYE
ncbi:ABC transporter permease [Thermodesulfobacteriota bacterium]